MADIQMRPALADDMDALCELTTRAEAHNGVLRMLEVEELRADLDDKRVKLAADVRLATIGGQLAGYVYCYYLPKYVRVSAYDHVVAAHRLFARVGFAPVRFTDELLRPLTDLQPETSIDGVTIVPWPDDRDEEIRSAKNEEFEDHWGSTPTTSEDWQERVRGFGARPDLSFVAIDASGDVIAHCLNKRFDADDAVTGRRDGWIDNVGTRREWRGRGVASALISASLHAFADARLTHASIEVDSENHTGAARLYRSLGFEPVHRAITHQIRVE